MKEDEYIDPGEMLIEKVFAAIYFFIRFSERVVHKIKKLAVGAVISGIAIGVIGSLTHLVIGTTLMAVALVTIGALVLFKIRTLSRRVNLQSTTE